MLTAQRHSLIRQIVRVKSSVSVAELAKKCDASVVTIRRDLASLERDGIVVRIRGGATLADLAPDRLVNRFEEQCSLHYQEKQLIGSAASALIEPGETIIIDSGSTTLELAKNLAELSGVTIFTPSIRTAEELEHYTAINTILTGGTLRSRTSSLVNPVLDKSLQSVMAAKVFLGVTGVSAEFGLTTGDFAEADVKKILISHAQEVIVLTDSSKLDHVSPAFIAKLEQVHTLVTDYKADPDFLDSLRKNGLKVVIAYPASQQAKEMAGPV